jgi:hypothetical protein
MLVGILYVLVVLFIDVWVIVPRQRDSPYGTLSKVEYVAVRHLKANTRIRAEYLVAPRELPPGYFWYLPERAKFQGMYLKADVPKGNPVTPEMLVPWPDLTPPPDGRAVAFALKDQPTAEFLNAGARVDLCPATGDCLVRAAEVQAVVCSATSPPACHAVIFLKKAEVNKILRGPKADILLATFP